MTRPWLYVAVVATAVQVSPMLATVSAQSGPSIVISELRFRGSGSADEFIELFNPTPDPVHVGGWTISGSDGAGNVATRAVMPDVTINSGCFFLVTHQTGYQGVIPGDLTHTLSLADNGGVAIADANGAIVDQVGFSAGSAYKEPPTLSPLVISGDNSYERQPGGEAGHADTNNNEADFRLRSVFAIPPEPANPQNSQSPCISVVEPDDEAPVFDAEPEDVEAEATGPDGAVVNYNTPTATDNVDPVVEVSCEPASGTVFRLGDTGVLCSAEDAAGNAAAVWFTVTVQDTTAPQVAVPGNMTREATSAAPQLVTFDASATDAVTLDLPVLCLPASGSLFPLGVTRVTCKATDEAGNIGEAAFDVTIQDTTAPSLTVPANITAEADSPAGKAVTFAVSASDAVTAVPNTVCTPASGSTFTLGTTTVNCQASDDAGNSSAASFTVTVQDTTAPAISVPANITDTANSPAGRIVHYSVGVADAVTVNPVLTCSPASGSTFPIGTTMVKCTATDGAGNSAMASFKVTILAAVVGRMHGSGDIGGSQKVSFTFDVRGSAANIERASLAVAARNDGGTDRLQSTNVTDLRFSNDGRDVRFSGEALWNGRAGYRFTASACDKAEPGNGADTFAIVVTAPNGYVVLSRSGVLTSGNVQSHDESESSYGSSLRARGRH